MQNRDPAAPPEPPRAQGVRRVLRPVPRTPQPDPAAAPMEAEGRLLRPAAACPRCGARPAMRVTAAMVRALNGQETGVRVGTYQCQRRGCGAIYDLNAGAYLRAS
ncbi:MAG TPA: hypothetical protein VGB15_18435 [Longimicrobium sp.]